MTPNTSPEKPEWFSLIENDAPSAQVRRVDKRLTLSTAFAALAIAASGALFAGAATTSDGSAVQASAPETSALPVQGAITSAGVEKISAPSIGIADPTLNGGGQDDDDYDDDDDDDEDDYDDDEDED